MLINYRLLRYISVVLLLPLHMLSAQYEDRNWVFNINMGIKFEPDGSLNFFNTRLNDSVWAVPPTTCISSRLGELLLYAGYHDSIPQPSTSDNFLFGRTHEYISNSLDLIDWHGMVLILPADTSERYYHYIHQYLSGQTNGRPIHCSEIDLWGDNQLGEITGNKNISFFPNQITVSNFGAVRHANGRDWWILGHQYGNTNFLITHVAPGCNLIKKKQAIGDVFGKYDNGTWAGGGGAMGHFIFNRSGTQMVSLCSDGMIELFNFDRCEGVLSNYRKIREGSLLGSGEAIIYGACLSPSGRYLYTSGVNPLNSNLSYIDQYDLMATDILGSRVILYTSPHKDVSPVGIALAPNNKIFFAIINYISLPNNYPKQNHLGVINEPDQGGIACNLNPQGLYLNGGRSAEVLPYIPNLHIGPIDGSVCDTLGIDAVNSTMLLVPPYLQIYPQPADKYIELSMSENISLFSCIAYDILGKSNIISESAISEGTYRMDVSGLMPGMYILKLNTSAGELIQKVSVVR
jgi:hypothetical protein